MAAVKDKTGIWRAYGYEIIDGAPVCFYATGSTRHEAIENNSNKIIDFCKGEN